MKRETREILQGTADLLQTGVEEGMRQLLGIQLSVTGTVYRAVRFAGAPVCLINGIQATQEAMTRLIYGSVVMGSRGARAGASTLLALLAARNPD